MRSFSRPAMLIGSYRSFPCLAPSTILLLIATLLWVAIVVFSLVGPVPINNQVQAWDIQHLPPDWRHLRRRWDQLHAIRVVMIASAFLALVVSYRTLG